MCLILFANDAHPRYRLVLAANRDELHGRPTRAAAFWEDAPDVLAGRDLVGGGTWMGVTRSGRVAAVTNFRDGRGPRDDARSRGRLVGDFLTGDDPPEGYARRIHAEGAEYNGFSLIVGHGADTWFCSNHDGEPRKIEPGVHGLSNHLLDTPWPKVENGRRSLADALRGDTVDPARLLAMLDDRMPAPDGDLPHTGIDLERERVLSPIFIHAGEYGTRSSSVLLIERGGRVAFVERSYSAAGRVTGEVSFELAAPSLAAGPPGRV
jgi:uncharacterized protein with NRDE domain